MVQTESESMVLDLLPAFKGGLEPVPVIASNKVPVRPAGGSHSPRTCARPHSGGASILYNKPGKGAMK